MIDYNKNAHIIKQFPAFLQAIFIEPNDNQLSACFRFMIILCSSLFKALKKEQKWKIERIS